MQIAIPLYQGFTALDAIGPYEVLSRVPGATVTFVAERGGPVTTDTGSLTLVAAPLDELRHADIVVVPGGPGTRRMLEDHVLIEWIRTAHETSTWTTSVCTGALLLAAAGVLDGVDATTHWLAMDLLAALGARPVQERVVIRGKVVTAAGVSAGIDMALTLVDRMAGPDVAQAIQLSIEYDPHPPFTAGSPAQAPAHVVDIVKGVFAASAR